ncbi:ParA family protein [Desulfovibrio sp. DV]|uniref:ParA family protein n=1 Tax=Desulfovibrio sp. DV TaxID=1844708 RepID=UPI00094B8789|nr:ParA family protein [Desulfovibrio sp. DV]
MPTTLVVSNRKGGAGKTTVSVNLAAALAALGRRVLLVDLDSQSHCAMGVGIKVGKTTPTSHDLFRSQEARLAAAILPTAFPNLALVPADPLFEHGSGRRDEGLLAQALAEEEITTAFDVVILDTPPSLDILLLNALMAADWVLVPYVPHPLSFEGVRQLTRVLFKIISGPNQGLKLAGFLPMMAAEHIRQHRAVNSDVARQFGDLRILPGIRNDIRLAESFGAGKPIHYYAPQSRAAEDFAILAAVITEKVWNS